MDLNSVKILNPWWENSDDIEKDDHIRAIIGKPFYFDHPIKQELPLTIGHTFILRGPRQVGKTTLLKEKIREALTTKKVLPNHCIFLSCEALVSFDKLQELLAILLNEREKSLTLLCLDEITFIKEWQRALLWLSNAGLLKNTVTFITGSDAHDLKLSAERFPGRNVREIPIHPFSYQDYFKIACFKKYSKKELFDIYLKVGGFPHAIADFYHHGHVRDQTYEIYMNWIFGDASRYQLSRELLTHLLFRIFDTVGSQVTWQRLIETSPVKSYETALTYVEHLELAFLCHVLPCYDPDTDMNAPRKAKKIYLIDPLLYALTGGFMRGVRNCFAWWTKQINNPDFTGKLFESIVLNKMIQHHKRVYYWYSSNLKREIDVLIKENGNTHLYEIKMSPQHIKPALGKTVEVITPTEFMTDE